MASTDPKTTNTYDASRAALRREPRTWLVTGAAGFIGSHLARELLSLDQHVVGLDSFATGHRRNVDDVLASLPATQAARLRFIEADIRDPAACREACRGVDHVLHQAALGSVPRSIRDPLASHETNVTGFLNVLWAARDAGVKRFVYASSSSVYGDHPGLPKVEGTLGELLSPYAATKRANELYAATFQRTYGIETVGLRYFNVFGPRQDPAGPYAAVLPRWFAALLRGEPVEINGDGETSRDFCYVANAVQANLLAAIAGKEATGRVYNVAFGERTTLNELFALVRAQVARFRPEAAASAAVHREFRPGDIRHSLADVSLARRLLGYHPTHSVRDGLVEASAWYATSVTASPTSLLTAAPEADARAAHGSGETAPETGEREPSPGPARRVHA
jgi:UDP-N-acetylglucosamine/UDP-N-acetylgalactosamine 4-epimerase